MKFSIVLFVALVSVAGSAYGHIDIDKVIKKRQAMLNRNAPRDTRHRSNRRRVMPGNPAAIDARTGKYYAPTGPNGVVDPRTGKFYPDVGPGYIDPKTGRLLVKY